MRKLGILIAVVIFGLMVFAEADLHAVVSRLELLEEYTNMIYDSLQNYVQLDTFEEVVSNFDVLTNRLELLEEYTNMIYETLGGYVSVDDFEAFKAEIETRLSELEVQVLNIQNTLDTGMPALREMIYGLSESVANLEERLSSYVDVSVGEVKDQLDEVLITIEDLRVTLDIHDGDILKIYETLGTLSEQVAALEEKMASLKADELAETLESIVLKLDMHDQDIVNIFDNLSNKADREQVDTLEASVAELYDSVNGLNEILTGLAAQIGDTDYLLRKQIENLGKEINGKLDNYAKKEDVAKVNEKVDAALKESDAKIQNVNIVAWLGVVLGAIAIILPFVNGQ